MSKQLKRALVALALSALVSGVQAQRPWLLASSTVVDSKDPWVTVDAASADNAFDIDNMPLKLDALVVTGPDAARVVPVNVFFGHLRSSFDIKLAQPGTYKASLVTTSVMANYKLNGEMKRWRGSEQDLAAQIPSGAQDLKLTRMHSRLETFVSTGKLTAAVFKTTGEGLEFVPITHPNDMRAGDKASWRFLLDGKPLANQPFSLVLGGVRYRGVLGEIRQTTDANGEISFTVPAAGMYLLSSNWPETAPGPEGQPRQAPARRLSYGATLEVLPQ